ncbi:MAG: hypothetical protein M0031_02945 [Thermaerobacter sp.]|nr:hypothetical protein [Thermaerobacter sp.]
MKWTRKAILEFLEEELAATAGAALPAERVAAMVAQARAGQRQTPSRRGDGRPTYRQEWVRCRRPGCVKCGEGPGHGPYWYAYHREGGRLRKKYIGRELPMDGSEPGGHGAGKKGGG